VSRAKVDLGLRSETIRRANLSAIVRALHEDGHQSRSDLVARTGLTRSAIRALVGELTSAGLAVEDRTVLLGRPGRPSPEVRLVPEAATAIAMFIAVDSLAAAVVGLGGDLLAEVREDRPRGHTSVGAIADDLVELVGRLPAGAFQPDSLAGVGIAVAGVVRRNDGVVESAPNLGWSGAPLARTVSERLAWDVPVLVGNEADLGLLAEVRRGAAIGVDDVLYVHGEVGVGGGMIVDGRLMTGAAGYFGEIGHFPMAAGGAPCRCGSHGCWETEIGAEALLARAGLPTDGGAEAIDALLAAAAAGDARVLAAIDQTGEHLGIGLAGFVNTFNPRLVVLGGLFARLLPYAQTSIRSVLARRTMAAPLSMVTVVAARLGDDAPLLGAAELALEAVLEDPASRIATRDDAVELATA
jgi:predicted NBD/HSP70 family sugar kinase